MPQMASSGGDDMPKDKVSSSLPEGLEVPLCWCQDPCKLWKSQDMADTYGRRFFMCANYEWELSEVRPYDRRPPVKLFRINISHTIHYFVAD